MSFRYTEAMVEPPEFKDDEARITSLEKEIEKLEYEIEKLEYEKEELEYEKEELEYELHKKEKELLDEFEYSCALEKELDGLLEHISNDTPIYRQSRRKGGKQ